jgi:hypothetical protein
VKHTDKIAPVAAALSALATLTCCLPVGVAAAAATASVAAVIAPLRPWFLGVSTALLAVGAIQVTRARACATGRARIMSVIVWSASVVIVFLVAWFPQLIAAMLADLIR